MITSESPLHRTCLHCFAFASIAIVADIPLCGLCLEEADQLFGPFPPEVPEFIGRFADFNEGVWNQWIADQRAGALPLMVGRP